MESYLILISILLIRVMRLQYYHASKSYDKVLNDIVLINQNNEVTT